MPTIFLKSKLRDLVYQEIRAAEIENLKAKKIAAGESFSADISYRRFLGWGGFGKETLQKEKISLNEKDESFIEFIHNKTLASKPTSFVWHTTAENITKALEWGMLKPQTLTGIAISEIGKYRLKVAERALKSQIISNKADAKEELIEIFQSLIHALKPLERLVFTGVNKEIVDEQLDSYINNLETIKTSAFLSEKSAIYDFDIAGRYQEMVDSSIEKAKALRSIRKDPGNMNDVLYQFIFDQIKSEIRHLETCNQILAFNNVAHAGNRGDLQNCCVDARWALNAYQRDFHNPITKKHQYQFNQEGLLAIDSEQLGMHTREAQEKFLMGVAYIERKQKDDTYLMVTRATKWMNVSVGAKGGRFNYQRLGVTLFNYTIGLFIAIGKFVENSILGEKAKLCAKGFLYANHEKWFVKPIVLDGSFSHLANAIQTKDDHVSTIFGRMFNRLVVKLIFDAVKQFVLSAIDTFETLPKLILDAKNGYWGTRIRRENDIDRKKRILLTLSNELKAISQEEENIAKAFGVEFKKESLQYALPEYALTHYQTQGLIPTLVNGGISFIDLFEKNIYDMHPFTGLVFTSFYIAGAGSILAPQAFAFLGPYVQSSQAIGAFMTKGSVSQAVASGFFQAKASAAIFEGINHGMESWIATGIREIAKQPVLTAATISAAYTIGFLVCNVIDIPGVSEKFNHELSDNVVGRIIGQAFAGGKLTVGALELIMGERHGSHAERTEKLKSFLSENIEHLIATDDSLSQNLKHKIKDEIQLKIEEVIQEQYISKIRENLENPDLKTPIPESQFLDYLIQLKLNSRPDRLNLFSLALKEDLKELLPEILKSDSMTRTYAKLLNPPKYTSPIGSIIKSIFRYPGLIIRTLFSLIFGTKRPRNDLYAQIKNDVVSTVTGIIKIVDKSFEMLKRVLCVAGDIIGNLLIARIAGATGHHEVTQKLGEITVAGDKLTSMASSVTGEVVNILHKSSTEPHISRVQHFEDLKFSNQLFKAVKESVSASPEKQATYSAT